MPGLQDKIIIMLRSKFACDGGAAYLLSDATRHQMLEIRLPLSEIIVHIQAGNTTLLCFTLKLCDVVSHGYGMLDKFFTLMEFQVIDHVDQKKRDGTFVKYAIIVHDIAGQ